MKVSRWKIAQWFEQKWWQNYLKKKDPKKYLEWKKDYWVNFLKKASFQIDSNISILDAGCGPAGCFLLSENKDDNKWIAIDPLLNNYDKLSIFNRTNHPNVSFINTSFEEYLHLNKFDLIFCINAINHFIEINPNFRKLHNLLSDSGIILLSIDTHNFSFLKWFFYFLPFDILHPHQYTAIEYEKMLLDNKLKIVDKVLIKKEFIFSYHLYTIIKNDIIS